MSHSSSSKKTVFDRIGGRMSSATPTNVTSKNSHGLNNTSIKSSSSDQNESLHEPTNVEKSSTTKDEIRLTKTITRVVDMSSSMKSTVTVSNDQRPVITPNAVQSTRTVVESHPTSNDRSDRRLSTSDRKSSHSRHSDSKTKSSITSMDSSKKKKSSSSSHESRHLTSKKSRPTESDSEISSASDSESAHSSHKRKKKSEHSSSSSKHKKHKSKSPMHDDEETLQNQFVRQNKSPKRTIVLGRPEETKKSKIRTEPEIEFLGLKKAHREKKANETIHQQAENNKKIVDVKRERKSPSKTSNSDLQRPTSIAEKNLSIKTEDSKSSSNKAQSSSERYERSDRNISQATPPVLVRLSLTPPTIGSLEPSEKQSTSTLVEEEKVAANLPISPPCVILDDDSNPPTPSMDKKSTSQISVKKSNETEKITSKSSQRSRDSDKTSHKDKFNDTSESKRKRPIEESPKKSVPNSKSINDTRSTSSRSDARRNGNASSRDDSSSRKYKEKSSRPEESKDRSSITKSRSNNDRRDTSRNSSERKRSSQRHPKEKENGTDSEEHVNESVVSKPTTLELFSNMDWSQLSRDKRVPLNSQVTSRVTRVNGNSTHILDCLGVAQRLLTDEQKAKLTDRQLQKLPLTHHIRQLQNQSSQSIIQSCQRRFGSCAKDMIDMRHKWFIRSVEPVQQYEFLNKEHYVIYQQAINALLHRTSSDIPIVSIETSTADDLLS